MRDDRAPVAALRAVARVAEPAHQLDLGLRDARGIPAALVGRPGEAVAGHRRADDVEGVAGRRRERRVAAADDLLELDDRARPAVRDDERERVRPASTSRG